MAEYLIRGKSRGHLEKDCVQYDSVHHKAEPGKHLKILSDQEVAQIMETIGIDSLDK